MNERIKLLKNQASVWCDQNIPDQYSEETNGYGSAWEDKLAELIVRECTNILMKPSVMEWDEGLRSELSEYNKGWVNGRLLGIEHIKEHFGVEE